MKSKQIEIIVVHDFPVEQIENSVKELIVTASWAVVLVHLAKKHL